MSFERQVNYGFYEYDSKTRRFVFGADDKLKIFQMMRFIPSEDFLIEEGMDRFFGCQVENLYKLKEKAKFKDIMDSPEFKISFGQLRKELLQNLGVIF